MISLPNTPDLDVIFEALANKHRREIVYALGLRPYSISELAVMRDLSLPAIHKHIKVLEESELIRTKKIGRVHVLTLNRHTLLNLQNWLMQYQAYWGGNEESLENYSQHFSKTPMKGGEKK